VVERWWGGTEILIVWVHTTSDHIWVFVVLFVLLVLYQGWGAAAKSVAPSSKTDKT